MSFTVRVSMRDGSAWKDVVTGFTNVFESEDEDPVLYVEDHHFTLVDVIETLRIRTLSSFLLLYDGIEYGFSFMNVYDCMEVVRSIIQVCTMSTALPIVTKWNVTCFASHLTTQDRLETLHLQAELLRNEFAFLRRLRTVTQDISSEERLSAAYQVFTMCVFALPDDSWSLIVRDDPLFRDVVALSMLDPERCSDIDWLEYLRENEPDTSSFDLPLKEMQLAKDAWRLVFIRDSALSRVSDRMLLPLQPNTLDAGGLYLNALIASCHNSIMVSSGFQSEDNADILLDAFRGSLPEDESRAVLAELYGLISRSALAGQVTPQKAALFKWLYDIDVFDAASCRFDCLTEDSGDAQQESLLFIFSVLQDMLHAISTMEVPITTSIDDEQSVRTLIESILRLTQLRLPLSVHCGVLDVLHSALELGIFEDIFFIEPLLDSLGECSELDVVSLRFLQHIVLASSVTELGAQVLMKMALPVLNLVVAKKGSLSLHAAVFQLLRVVVSSSGSTVVANDILHSGILDTIALLLERSPHNVMTSAAVHMFQEVIPLVMLPVSLTMRLERMVDRFPVLNDLLPHVNPDEESSTNGTPVMQASPSPLLPLAGRVRTAAVATPPPQERGFDPTFSDGFGGKQQMRLAMDRIRSPHRMGGSSPDLARDKPQHCVISSPSSLRPIMVAHPPTPPPSTKTSRFVI